MSSLVIPFNSSRLIVLADVHLDSYARHRLDPFAEHGLDPTFWQGVDGLIVASNLSDRPRLNWPRAFRHLRRFIAPELTYVLPGNHDFYRHYLEGEDELRKLAEDHGVHYLQKAELRHGRMRYLCATLWTDFDLFGDARAAMAVAAQGMRDYREIGKQAFQEDLDLAELRPRPRLEPITPADKLMLRRDHRGWLEQALSQPHFAGEGGRTVVVSHHGPSRATAGALTALSPAFHSGLDGLISRHKPQAWAFGHSHRRLRAEVAGCDIRNVGLGYRFEPRSPGDCDILDTCFFHSLPWTPGA